MHENQRKHMILDDPNPLPLPDFPGPGLNRFCSKCRRLARKKISSWWFSFRCPNVKCFNYRQ